MKDFQAPFQQIIKGKAVCSLFRFFGKWVPGFDGCHCIAKHEVEYISLFNKVLGHESCCANKIATKSSKSKAFSDAGFIVEGLYD